MSIGSWDPTLGAAEPDLELTRELLERLAGYSSDDQLDSLAEVVPEQEQQSLAGLMQVDHGQWQAACEDLDSTVVLHLIRFFAVAENLPGWEAGEKSPVIPLAKILRKRGERLDRDTLLWLREVNNNRFLPYGPL